jgi:hypothetical protein
MPIVLWEMVPRSLFLALYRPHSSAILLHIIFRGALHIPRGSDALVLRMDGLSQQHAVRHALIATSVVACNGP